MTIALAPTDVRPSRRTAARQAQRVVVSSSFATFAVVWPRASDPGEALFHVFQSAEFLECWLDTIGPARGVTPCFCAVLDARRVPIMLLPFGIEKRDGVRILTFLDGEVSDYNAPVFLRGAPDWSADEAREILQDVFDALPPFDIALLEKMPADILGRPNPLLHLGTEPWPCHGHAAKMAGSWTAYADDRIKHPKRFARYYRQLTKAAPVSYVAADKTNYEPHLEQLFAQKEARFIETHVPGFSEHPGMQAFYREATKRFLGKGLVHLSAIHSGKQAIAAQWGLRQGDRYYYLICGYEAGEWQKYSPGRLITEAMLKWCHESGLSIADFGIGDEAYKFEYCAERLELHRAVKPVTLRGRLYVAGMRLMERARGLSLWQRLRPYKWKALRYFKGASPDAQGAG